MGWPDLINNEFLLIKKEKFMSQRGITINAMQLGPVSTDLNTNPYGRYAGVRHTP